MKTIQTIAKDSTRKKMYVKTIIPVEKGIHAKIIKSGKITQVVILTEIK